MRILPALILSALCVLISVPSLASEESPVVLGSFEIKSQGNSKTGEVIVSGESDVAGVKYMTISAFGRDIRLNKKDLEKLKGMHLNAVQLSYDGGYESAESGILIVRLSTGYVIDTVDSRYIFVRKTGNIDVYGSLNDLMGK
jgi:hypothetical protein